MAFLGIAIPEPLAIRLQQLEVPGKRDTTPHVTLFYFPELEAIDQIFKIIESTLELTSETLPFELTASEVNCFDKGEDGVPIKLEVESLDLIKFRKKLAFKLDDNKVNYSKKFPKFQPHITLSYADEAIKSFKIKPALSFQVNEIVLWAGSWGPTKLVCHFPLEFTFNQKINKLAKFTEVFQKII